MKVFQLAAEPIMTPKEADALAGLHLPQSACKTLITYDADVTDAETGKVLAKFRKGVIPPAVQRRAFESFITAAGKTSNRGVSAGWDERAVRQYVKAAGGVDYVRQEGSVRFQIVYADRGVSKTNHAVPVESGTIGYMDRNPRFPNCRQTAFNQHHLEKFKAGYPIIKMVDGYYRDLMPEQYRLQREEADRTAQDFVIKNTAFTTVTVNRNWQTAVHKDAGDFEQGFGNLVALRAGEYEGGHLVLPRHGVGFDLQNGDLLLMDVHEWHGNTPIIEKSTNPVRLSLVMYYRKNMIHCDSAEAELARVKRRKPGDKIN